MYAYFNLFVAIKEEALFTAIKEEALDSNNISPEQLYAEFSEPSNKTFETRSRRRYISQYYSAQPKYKVPDNLSKNINTKRSRYCIDTFTDKEKELENTKKADNTAIGYQIRKYTSSDIY